MGNQFKGKVSRDEIFVNAYDNKGTGARFLISKFLITKFLITLFLITVFLSNKVPKLQNS
jgi:hypothetical protein